MPTKNFPGMGRIPAPDARDLDFPITALVNIRQARRSAGVAPPVPPPESKTLPLRWRGDQSYYPVCVGAFGVGALRAQPSKWGLGKLDMFALYRGAQQYDEWPGEGYDGTSARGLFRFLVEFHPAKDVNSYWWAFTPEQVKLALVEGHPVGLGIDMRSEMMDPTGSYKYPHENGYGALYKGYPFMHYTGAVQGGHQMLIIGYAKHGDLFLVQNSWGDSWGFDGRAWISAEDLRKAFTEAADCGVMVKEKRP